MKNESIDTCLICESDSLEYLKGFEKDHLVRCRQCSFVFSRLRPTQDELNQTYSAYQRGSNAPTTATLQKLRARAKSLCEKTNVRTVLDVGCGDGHFLAIFSEMGCRTYGTEFDSESAKVAKSKGAIMLEGGLTPRLCVGISGFDVIIFTEVIEHINNPRPVLEHFYQLLNPGGLLFITTPNFDGLERYMLGPSWGMIKYPEHIAYYSPRTLDNIGRLCGLNKVQTYTENISLFRIVQFANRFRKAGQINAERVSAKAQLLVSDNKVASFIKTCLNGVLGLTNMGTSIVATYQKRR